MAKLRVGVLFGGQSVEHEVSLVSAQSVIRALSPTKYEVLPIGITQQGKWLPPAAATGLLAPGPDHGASSVQANGTPPHGTSLVALEQPDALFPELDVIFPVLHGTLGEDGTVQGLLELTDLPYVGAGVLASALGMDKVLMKRGFREAGLPVVKLLTVLRREWEQQSAPIAAEVTAKLGYPCFVKPANGGSSVGVTKVREPATLGPALDLAFSLDRKVLIEEAIIGRELECSVLGNDDPIASAVGEVAPSREFYDYEAKYHDETTRLIVPASLEPGVAEQVRELAARAFRAIDCAGMARVDFFLRASDGALFVSEINTIPGFTPVSMYPRMWEATGLPYTALLDRLIELALERHREKKRTRYSYPTGAV